MDESQLIKECQKGNLTQFQHLYDQYYQAIYRFIYYRVHHRETAEDLTSTVFYKALEHISQYKPHKGAFSAWLYRIARNAIIDHFRQAKGTDDITLAFDLTDGTNIPRDFDAREQLEKVKRYLAELDGRQRDIVVMRVWDGLSHREIAELLDMTEASVKMAFSRTMAKLNKELAFVVALLSLIIHNS